MNDRELRLLARVSKARANLKQARIKADKMSLTNRTHIGRGMVLNAQTELMYARNALSDYGRLVYSIA